MKRLCMASGIAALALALAACSKDDAASTESNVLPPGDDAATVDPGSGLDAALTDPNTDAGTSTVDAACGGTSVKATARDANLLLVLDASGSMLQKPAGFAINKWQAVAASLRDALGPNKEKLSLGLELFPYGVTSADACALPTGEAAIEVPIGPGGSTLDTIVSRVSSVSPGGATPTAKALAAAKEYFTTGAGKALSGDKYVILATDGGPNCNSALTCGADTCTTNIDGNCSSGNCCDPSISRITCLDGDGVKEQLAALRTAGVRTFVVGIPGTEAYKTWLDAFAEAGGITSPTGPDKYFSVSAAGGVAGLTSVFSLITGEMITACRINLERAAPDPTKVNVYVDDESIPQGGDDGWEYDESTDPPSIVIKGKTCEQVKSKGARAITVEYGCPTIR